jgi:hypothetical protein
MALSYKSYDDELTGQSRIHQRSTIENHGKINFHLDKNDQLPNVNFINYGEVNVYVNSPAKSKVYEKAIDNSTTTHYSSNSCERLLPAPQIEENQFNFIPSDILFNFFKFIIFTVILYLICLILSTIFYIISFVIFFFIIFLLFF